MSKNITIILSVVLLIIVLVGGYSLFRMNQSVSGNAGVENTNEKKPNTLEENGVIITPRVKTDTTPTPAPTEETSPISTVPTTSTNSVANFTTDTIVDTIKSPTLGEYLTDVKGMTLYLTADDKNLTSSCTGECVKTWIPFMYDNEKVTNYKDTLSQRMNVVKRPDGTLQYAYGAKPLYYYVGDKNVGDVLGNGLNSGKWSIVLVTK